MTEDEARSIRDHASKCRSYRVMAYELERQVTIQNQPQDFQNDLRFENVPPILQKQVMDAVRPLFEEFIANLRSQADAMPLLPDGMYKQYVPMP